MAGGGRTEMEMEAAVERRWTVVGRTGVGVWTRRKKFKSRVLSN